MASHRKRFLLILIYLGIALPWIVQGTIRALDTRANSPIDWVAPTFPARAEYDRFQNEFGAGDVLIVSWDGCRIDDQRVDLLVKVLERGKPFFDGEQHAYFQSVTSGRSVLAQLMSVPFHLSHEEAVQRLRGVLVGQDGQTTCVQVTFTPKGVERRADLVPLIRRAVEKVNQVDSAGIHLAGPIMDGLSVDQAGRSTMDRYAPLSSLVVLLLCWLSLRSMTAALLVFLVSVLCQGITLATIDACGDSMSALLIVMPPLIQVLAVAGGVHLVNYYFGASASLNPTDSAVAAWRLGWLPCSLSAATTAVGLGSLCVSGLVPVRAFGGYAAIGVMVTLAMTLICIPGFLLFRPVSDPRRQIVVDRTGRYWEQLVGGIRRTHWLILLVAVPVMIGAGTGVTRIRTSVHMQTLFSPGSRILADYEWLEDHIGDLVPIEVVLHCESDCSLASEQQLDLLQRLHGRLLECDTVSTAFSPVSFLPSASARRQLAAPIESNHLRFDPVEARQVLTALSHTGCFADRGSEGHEWRLTAFVSALDNRDYGQLLESIRTQIEPEIENEEGLPPDDVRLRLTGIMPLVHSIQSQLLEDLFISFLTAFGVIALVMTLVQSGVIAGLVSMTPNVFPALVMFGGLGWFDIPVDIGSVMTASVAIGIAVDDTLHFLTFFRRQLAQTGDRTQAVLAACRHCGAAMIQTSVACGLGLLVFALSDFVPTARFAWMMLSLLMLALVGDLVILPAILIGPLGRLFEPPAEHSLGELPPESDSTG